MKRLLLITLFVGLLCSANAQQKAFGDLCFGMTKKEAKTAYKANKENHKIEIGGFYFHASPHNCKYDENGLFRVSLYALCVPFKKYLDENNTENLMKAIKKVFTEAGYDVIDQHVFWPKPILMVREDYCLAMNNKETQKIMIIRIPSRGATKDSYSVFIDLFPQSYADDLVKMENQNIKNKAAELNSKL